LFPLRLEEIFWITLRRERRDGICDPYRGHYLIWDLGSPREVDRAIMHFKGKRCVGHKIRNPKHETRKKYEIRIF
jgi:hypothetical protein